MSFFDTSIEYLKGVGPQRADILKKEISVFNFRNLIEYFPFRYIDKSQFHKIDSISVEQTFVQLKGTIVFMQELGAKRAKRLVVKLEDETGSIELIWFKGIKWIKPNLHIGDKYIAFGRPSLFNGKFNLAHPEIEKVGINTTQKAVLQPVYHGTEKLSNKGLNSKGIEKLIKTLLPQLKGKVAETLPQPLIKELGLLTREQALMNVHNPGSLELSQKAQFRLKFEELFYVQLQLLMTKQINTKRFRGFVFEKVGDKFNQFYNENLKFELTGAQKRVLKEIRKNVAGGLHMNRLLQGDVGSGKTLVATLSMLLAIDNGFQAALMAPTEILSIQHYNGIKEDLEGTGVEVALLTGSTKKKERAVIHEKLLSGDIDILIGTHALLEDIVQFKNLGFVVIDEQHRFGVAQRSKLWKKNTISPHILVMTATPIPRTLAMTLYGDLDISVIDELPMGRKPIVTTHKFEKSRINIFGFLEKEIEKGRQVYIVYPLIEESEKLDYNNLMEGYESISRRFPLPKYRVSIVHGKMKPADKEIEMQKFAKGETQIMVATTVIEVGVNVPNATVMVIENSEKFGLSQLHQLRGRVGRGGEQSYCILMSSYKLTPNGRKRLETMVRTTDGFEISEVDLELRGPGDIMGTQQSGILDLKIADLAKDNKILVFARSKAIELLEDDPQLKKPENKPTAIKLFELLQSKSNWSRIS